MRHFPVFLDLRGRRVLVLGAGEVAARKAEPLRRAGAELRLATRFDAADLHGCAFAIGADAPEAELRALAQAGLEAGIPVNVVDRPELGSCILPALVDRAPITIAIATAGAAPVLARLLRARIESVVPPAFGRLAALAESFKERARAAFPDVARRRRVLEGLLSGPAADLVLAGRETEARTMFEQALRGEAPAEGVVYLVHPGPGAADLLTLRALRLLGEADVIVHDAEKSPEVLDMARRDATREAAPADAAPLLAALARGGRRVVRLTRSMAEAAALREAGVLVELVPR